ncbi:MAG: methylenetetrahydrofolate reductase, partial [Pseudomonadota bacterium]
MLPSFSLEVFSPKTASAAQTLQSTLASLTPFGPTFTSVTVGTGNGSPCLTDETLTSLKGHAVGDTAAHIASAGFSLDALATRADHHLAQGVKMAVAIRGDDGGRASVPVPKLVDLLCQKGFRVVVGAYPETHPQAASDQACLDMLKAKQDAGATAAITQFFFHADTFFRFQDRARATGITLDLIPGILPVVNWDATSR